MQEGSSLVKGTVKHVYNEVLGTCNKIHSLYFTRQMSLVYYRWLCKRFKISAALVIAENNGRANFTIQLGRELAVLEVDCAQTGRKRCSNNGAKS